MSNDLYPDHFYRWSQGPKFFGYSRTQLRERVDRGDIPAPVALADDGRALGWFGRVIIKWQREREEKAAAKRAAAQ